MAADNWLDTVAKSLARSHSRRDVLRGLSAAIGGAALTTLFPAPAEANPNCVEVCKDRGLTGRELGDCIAECAPGIPCGDDRCDSTTEYCAACKAIDGGVMLVCLQIGAVC